VPSVPAADRSAGVERLGSGFTAPDGDFGVRLQKLAHVAADLAAVDSVAEVAEVVITRVRSAVQASVSALMVREGEQLRLVGSQGLHPAVSQRWATFAATDATPASEALRTGAPVVLADSDEVVRRYPRIVGDFPAGRSVVCLPLSAGQQPVGVLALTFDDGWVPGARELDYLTTVADACAQALRRIHTTQVAQEKAAQLTFLAEASAELASSLDYTATLRQVARLAVRTLSDWCAVAIVEEDVLTTVAVEHVDPAKVSWAWQLQDRYPPDPDAPTGAHNVVRTGRSELYTVITDEMLVAGARDEEHLALSRELRLCSAMVVPLIARGRTLGAITLLRAETGTSYTPADLLVAEDLGRRAGLAIDNARLHSQTKDIALLLQRAVLPARLTGFPSWEVATHYTPSGHADVGGDFYGATELSDGRLAVFIGDVMGHGVPAAAAMSQMRAAIRAYLCIDPDPAAVMSKLDAMFDLLALDQLVSVAFALIDPRSGELRITNAGHCPPMIVTADGDTRLIETPPGRILGAGGDHRTTTTWRLEPRSTLMLYTDGLVERRTDSFDAGLDRLLRYGSALAHPQLQSALDTLVNHVRHDDVKDDVTAIAVRREDRTTPAANGLPGADDSGSPDGPD
jgi:GAF domain-containing protein